MTETRKPHALLTPSEVATYVVCPHAWNLKRLHAHDNSDSDAAAESRARRQEWTASQELSSSLIGYAKTLFYLLLLIVISLFLWDHDKFIFHNRNEFAPKPRISEEP